MKSQDQADYLAKKEALLRNFEENAKPISNPGLDKEVRKLIVDLMALQHNLNSKDITVRQKLEKFATDEMAKFDPDQPNLTHSAKLLRLLAKSKAGSGAKYLEDLKTHEASLEGEKQSNRAKAKRRMKPLDALICQLLKSNPDSTAEQVYFELLNRKNEWPIKQVDDMYIEVFNSEDEKAITTYSVSGLGSRISKIKKML
jgi:hypothetical protein